MKHKLFPSTAVLAHYIRSFKQGFNKIKNKLWVEYKITTN